MANLREIKRRIKSVQNTQKITQAMRMVAAAKVKKAENAVKASKPYSEELIKAFTRVMETNPVIGNKEMKTRLAIDNYPALLSQRDIKTVGLLVITSDKGLAGAYNANIVRRAVSRIKELKQSGLQVKLFVVGQKGLNALKNTDNEIINNYVKLPAIPTVSNGSVIVEDIAEAYVKAEIDKIEVITTKFKSLMSFEVQNFQLLPVEVSQEKKENIIQEEMLFEPSPEDVLSKIVPLYLSNRVYQSLLESAASELAARMTAMAAATKNASEMIHKLSLIYNKARQSSITQELLEVVSGANALKG
ncbi:MAG: ATP synthase F1 subunit gamma [bacterium]